MAPSLEQEVNLSRRACRKNVVFNINKNVSRKRPSTARKLVIANYKEIKNKNENNCKSILLKLSQFLLSEKNNNKQESTISSINSNYFYSNNLKQKINKISYSLNKMTVFLVLFGILSCSSHCCARPNLSEGLSSSVPEHLVPPAMLSSGGKKIDDLTTEVIIITTETMLSSTTSNNIEKIDIIIDSSTQSDIEILTTKSTPVEKRYSVTKVQFERVDTPFIIGIWILSASIAKIGFHMTPNLNKIFPESCLLIVVGVIIGIVLYFATNVHISPLTPDTFFFYMLPPIILDAGYFMPNRLFFDNLGTILLMAVIGTIFNIGTIGISLWACGLTGIFTVQIPILHIFLFSSLISAVDPVAVLAVFEEIHVNEILYIVVFGESLLNDAVTVVLYHMFESYNDIGINKIQLVDVISGVASFFVVALGGTFIGVIWGFLTGLVTRFTDHVRVIEPIFIFVMAYLAYLNAEIFHMSGILAITFCGITMKNYVEANISHKSHTTVKYALKMLSSSSETIIFMFLGVATVNNRHVWNTWFIVLTILFCTVFRIFGVIILTAMANRFRLNKLSNVDQFVMSYGGLRGAVAFALVLLIDEHHVPLKAMFVTTTIAVVYFTVFVQGITIKPLVELLKVKRANKSKPTMNERIHVKVMDHLMAGLEDIIGKTGNYTSRDKFKRFDNRFIRPFLIRDLQSAEPKILETYSKLTMRDAIDIIRRNPSSVGQMPNTESMSALFRNYTGVFGGSPSFSNLENCSRNLDMQELDYNPSKKDLTDAKIHHLLAEELKPYRRHRRLSYSRHAVDDRDLSTQVNYKMHMNTRRMMADRKHHKRSKRLNKDGSGKQNHVSFPEFQQNGSAKQLSNDYINEVLQEGAEDDDKLSPAQNEDWDSGLTFTAKSSPNSPLAEQTLDRANNNSLIAHITSLPGFDSSKARIVKHYMSKSNSEKEIVPTAAELILPWRRDRSYQSFGQKDERCDDIKRLSKDSEGEDRVATPTATESVLPWKRGDDDDCDGGGAVQQNEFPAWASNKEYLAYNSPSATFLGGLSKPKQAKSVIGLFRRESSGSGSVSVPGIGGTTDSDTSIQMSVVTTPTGRTSSDKRSASIPGVLLIDDGDPLGAIRGPNAGPFPVTASHRRNHRRGSMLELTGGPIPEENYTKSLPAREKYGSKRAQPLLKITTPKSQNRRLNPQTTALLSTYSTDSDEDEADNNDDDNDEQNGKNENI